MERTHNPHEHIVGKYHIIEHQTFAHKWPSISGKIRLEHYQINEKKATAGGK